MSVTAKDLFGAWRLESWSFVYDDGRPQEFPLGRDSEGIIIYTPGGQVSATLMRAGRLAKAPGSEAERAAAFADSFAYAGRYEVRDGTVFHSIEVATNPALIGVTSTRHIKLDGDRLTLSGPDFAAGTGRTQMIVWLRST
ncbi:MAG: lipocalin-like domain-containing protein [Reyranella sp.]|uniref:lipocalin-like domain-containing protein n=1 Tax=Reyranella sp. TaxID=1929291 RepID=UPI002730C07F|nr:lipocalin-like domain-containing protein [Reyranella sp.]MDP1964370.1 lipocalin-like domain-containing protein [Reyranella sp.]MDP2372833.1 lipocalin-like domain-containing protein [Reyranella sp.]